MDIFEITKLLGSGQFSTVYKARWINAPLTPAYSYSPDVQNTSMVQPFEPAFNQQHQLMDQGNDNIQIIWNEFDELYVSNRHHQQQQQVFNNGNSKTGTITTGGCGATYKYVALKRIKFYEIPNSKLRVDCEKEVELLRQLKHPNIIDCNISFFRRNELYIVLELADGGDLLKLITYYEKRKQLICERVILKYFTQVCSAVRYIHSKRILHRDIKPANIFTTPDGCVKLGDFGLGRFFSQNTRDAHSLVGTFYYMSPERIQESGYSFSSDVWSLGCVLYELITFYSPFSIMNSIIEQPVDPSGHKRQNQQSKYNQKQQLTQPYQHQQQQQQQNPYNLQWLIDRIIRVDYPSLVNYTNISVRLRDLTTECLNQNPNARPNMDYICTVVDEAYRLQSVQQSMTHSNHHGSTTKSTAAAVSCRP